MSLVILVQRSLFALPPYPLLLTILLSIPLFLLLLISNRQGVFRKNRHLPPSPFKLPIIGNLHNMGSLPHRSLHALSLKYGPLMLLHLGQVPTLVVSSADVAREVMKTRDHVFASRPPMKVTKQVFYGSTDGTVIWEHGDCWRNERKVSVFHLLSNRMVQSYQHIREEEVAFMIGKISQSTSYGGLVNLSEILNSFANDIICRVVSGKCGREGGRSHMLCKLVEENSYLIGAFFMEDYLPSLSWIDAITGLDSRAKKAFKKWDKILDKIIEDHEHKSRDHGQENNDFVDVLLSLEKDPNLDFPITRLNIKAIIEVMFSAGTDTSYIVLEWAMAEVLRNSKVMKRLQDEIRGIASEKISIKEEDLSEMCYLKAVIKETLRLHPPAPLLLPRESMEDTQIQGYKIPKRTRVFVNAWSIGRDPKYWEAPEEFRPERFISSPVDFIGNDFQFIPFGAGRRICPGMGFAVSTLELALANLIHQFDWKMPDGMIRENLDMAEAPGLTTRMKHNLLLVATPTT